jgi:hypothetical protein
MHGQAVVHTHLLAPGARYGCGRLSRVLVLTNG